MIEHLIALIFLLLISIVDIFTFNKEGKGIPSALTTLFVILMFLLTFSHGSFHIEIILFSILIGLFLMDISFFMGLADLKVLVGLSFFFNSFWEFSVFTAVSCLLYSIMVIYVKKNPKKYKTQFMPYVPFLFLTYVIFLTYEIIHQGVLF